MSSTNSRDYYHSNNRGRPSGQSLPPLRSVLGDQLDLPFTTPPYQSPYDLGEIYDALPPASGEHSNHRNAHRSTPVSAMPADARNRQEQYPHPNRPYTYPPSTTAPHASRSQRTSTTYDGEPHAPSCSSGAGAERVTSKKYACTWEGCDKRFERQHALDTHMNIHLEQKPFACPVPHCGKVFNVRSNMRRHLLTHKDVPSDSQFAQEDDAEDDEREGGYFHNARHDSTYTSDRHRRSSENRHSSEQHRGAASGQNYYSSARRV